MEGSIHTEQWRPAAQALAGDYRTVVYDQRGHGRSADARAASQPCSPGLAAPDRIDPASHACRRRRASVVPCAAAEWIAREIPGVRHRRHRLDRERSAVSPFTHEHPMKTQGATR